MNDHLTICMRKEKKHTANLHSLVFQGPIPFFHPLLYVKEIFWELRHYQHNNPAFCKTVDARIEVIEGMIRCSFTCMNLFGLDLNSESSLCFDVGEVLKEFRDSIHDLLVLNQTSTSTSNRNGGRSHHHPFHQYLVFLSKFLNPWPHLQIWSWVRLDCFWRDSSRKLMTFEFLNLTSIFIIYFHQNYLRTSYKSNHTHSRFLLLLLPFSRSLSFLLGYEQTPLPVS